MSRLSKNIIYNLLGQGLLMVFGFVAVKYIFKQLGEDALGIIYFTTTMNAILSGVLEKGVFTTTVREVSAHFDNEPVYIHDFIRTGSFFCWGAYIIFSIAVYFGAPILVNKWINLTTINSATAIYILRVLGIASLVAFPLSFYASLLRGLQRMEFNNIIDVSASGLHQFGIVMILMAGGNIFHVAHWIAICYGLRVIGYLGVCDRFFPVQSFFPRYVHSVVKRNSEFSSKMVSISILAMVHRQSDKVMISKLLPIGLLGYYGFVYGAISKAGLITSAVAQAAFPSLCSLFGNKGRVSLVAQYTKLQDLVCFITVPIFALIAFASLPLLTFVFNSEIAEALHLPVILLSLGFYLNGTLAIPYRLLLAAGKPEIAVRQNLYAIFTVLPVTFVAIYFLELSGAALGWVLYFLFGYAYLVPRICSECLEKPAWFFYRHVLKVFLLTALTYGVAYGTLVVANILTIVSLFLAFMGASVIFSIGVYFLIGDELRKTALGHFRTLRDNLKFRTILSGNGRNSKYD
jgi:O-antigen/teichoic acid export membrane protein